MAMQGWGDAQWSAEKEQVARAELRAALLRSEEEEDAQRENRELWEQVFETKIALNTVKEKWNELKNKGAPEDGVLSSGGPATRWARARRPKR